VDPVEHVELSVMLAINEIQQPERDARGCAFCWTIFNDDSASQGVGCALEF